MPKGGLLHAHLDATVSARVLLQIALKYPAIHVRTAERLTSDTLKTVLPEFWPLRRPEWTALTSLTSDAYVPGSWVPLANARKTFAFGGPEGFDEWVVAALTINPSEAYGTHDTTAKVKSSGSVRVPILTRGAILRCRSGRSLALLSPLHA